MKLKKIFSIKNEVPQDFKGIPQVFAINAVFYSFKSERGVKDIDNLWSLFEIAIKYSSNKISSLFEGNVY